MNYKIKVCESVEKELESALKNFDLFLDVCRKKEIVVTDEDESVILLLITTMVEHNLEKIGSEELEYYLDNNFSLWIKQRGNKISFLAHPEEFLAELRKDVEYGLVDFLEMDFEHAIEVESVS